MLKKHQAFKDNLSQVLIIKTKKAKQKKPHLLYFYCKRTYKMTANDP